MKIIYHVLRKEIILVSMVAMVLPVQLLSQSADENYVKSISYQIGTLDGVVSDENKIENVTYFDGLGRPLQSVAQRVGSGGEDLITPVRYDSYGRQPREYLPYPNPNLSNDGQFMLSPLTPLYQYYYDGFPGDRHPWNSVPYSEKLYEDSSLGRVVEMGSPGKDWKINQNSDDDHTVKLEYDVNQTDNIYRFRVEFSGLINEDPQLVFDGWYPNSFGRIAKTVTKDENWKPGDGDNHTTHEFTNNLGQVILKRTFNYDVNTQQILNTYYVYDDFGNLTFVLSPEATPQIIDNGSLAANKQTILDELSYQYRYDEFNRLIEKKIPGKDWEYIVYNKLDQVIFTSILPKSVNDIPSQWLFTKYDAFGRAILTGLVDYSMSRAALQSLADGANDLWEDRTTTPTNTTGNPGFYYTNDALPTGINYEVLTVNYYDDYIDHSGVALASDVYGINPNYTDTKGLQTVSRVKVLDTDDWIVSIFGYDEKGRSIYSSSKNNYFDYIIDTSYNQLDFTGKPIETKTTHFKSGNAIITTYDNFTYDTMGRMVSHTQKIDDEPVQLIAKNHYDELGRLILKDVGGETLAGGYTDLEHVGVTPNATITNTYPNGWQESWPSQLKTKGEIPPDKSGGIKGDIAQLGKHVRIGLVKSSNLSLGNAYFDYGLYAHYDSNTGQSRIKLVNGTTGFSTDLGAYQAGDTFKVERVEISPSTFEIHFWNDGNQIHTITGSTLGNDAFVGKVSFTGPEGAQVTNLEIFSSDLDLVLQNVDYDYNIRGWLTDINDIDNAENPKSLDLFNFKISYNTIIGDYGSTTNEPLYNGNIAETIWQTKNDNDAKRSYGYVYDDLNRILIARNRTGPNLDITDTQYTNTLWGLDYDRNGNIKQLRRSGYYVSQSYDELVYIYKEVNGVKTNMLESVVDNVDPNCSCKDEGFKDGNTVGVDYEYDDSGNMIRDRNKGIYSITYNHLNLPVEIRFDSISSIPNIKYTYDANGTKLEKNYTNEGPFSTYYAGKYIYYGPGLTNAELQFISQPEGYLTPTTSSGGSGGGEGVKGFDEETGQTTYSNYLYVFQYKDHLGNIRLSYADSDLNGSIDAPDEIIEESNYYPFGLRHKGYNDVTSPNGNSLAQNFMTFQGQEFTEDMGLNIHEWKYRISDPTIGRFWQIDPLAEEYVYNGTYNFSENRVIDGVELEGLEVVLINEEEDPIIYNGGQNIKDKSAINIVAHGSPRGMEDIDGNWINTPEEFDAMLTRESPEWADRESNEGITICLHSCRVGKTTIDKEGNSVNSFAQKMSSSELFKGVTIIAPDERDVFSGNPDDPSNSEEIGPRKARYTDENSDYKPGTPREKRGQTTEERGNWNVFKNGNLIKSYDGDWEPKANPGILDNLFHKNDK